MSICPICDQPATRVTTRRHGITITVYCDCAQGHCWQIQWTPESPGNERKAAA